MRSSTYYFSGAGPEVEYENDDASSEGSELSIETSLRGDDGQYTQIITSDFLYSHNMPDLLAQLTSNPSLEVLKLDDAGFMTESDITSVMKSLLGNKSLLCVEFIGRSFLTKDIRSLSNWLSQESCGLLELVIDHCNIGNNIKILTKGLAVNGSVNSFSLKNSRISGSNAKDLIALVKESNDLKQLDLSGNAIDPTSIRTIMHWAMQKKTLHHINLSGQVMRNGMPISDLPSSQEVEIMLSSMRSNYTLTSFVYESIPVKEINFLTQRNKVFFINATRKLQMGMVLDEDEIHSIRSNCFAQDDTWCQAQIKILEDDRVIQNFDINVRCSNGEDYEGMELKSTIDPHNPPWWARDYRPLSKYACTFYELTDDARGKWCMNRPRLSGYIRGGFLMYSFYVSDRSYDEVKGLIAANIAEYEGRGSMGDNAGIMAIKFLRSIGYSVEGYLKKEREAEVSPIVHSLPSVAGLSASSRLIPLANGAVANDHDALGVVRFAPIDRVESRVDIKAAAITTASFTLPPLSAPSKARGMG